MTGDQVYGGKAFVHWQPCVQPRMIRVTTARVLYDFKLILLMVVSSAASAVRAIRVCPAIPPTCAPCWQSLIAHHRYG